MEREKAKEIITQHHWSFASMDDEVIEAVKCLMEDVEPCDDCISRQAVLDKAVYTETEEGWSGMTVDVKDIESLPQVTPKQSDVLEKIRAEIIEYEGNCRLSEDEYPSCKQCTDNVFETIYGIINKYKVESENEK